MFRIFSFFLMINILFLDFNLAEDLSYKESKNNFSNIFIEKIEIVGFKNFDIDKLQSFLEISVGDSIDRIKVIRSEEKLNAFYQSQGYHEMSVKSQLIRKRKENKTLETVLKFTINEGLPTKISKIKFSNLILYDYERKILEEKIEMITSKLPLKLGSILSYNEILESKRIIQEILISDDYILAKVDDVVISSALNKNKTSFNMEARWVELEFRVFLGEKISFGFLGNTIFSNSYLIGIINELKMLGMGENYLSIIEKKIKEEYAAVGYSYVKVGSYFFENSFNQGKKLVYKIEEGPLVKIDSLEFDGNYEFSSDDLKKLFFKFSSSFLKNKIYIKKDVQKTIDLIVDYMKEKGFLSARLVAMSIKDLAISRKKNNELDIKLTIYFYEGECTFIKNINISGFSVLDRINVLEILGVFEEKPLNLFAFNEGLESLKKIYKNLGYWDFKILNESEEGLINYYANNKFSKINIKVNEGLVYRVSRIEIDGLVKTKDFVVRRQMSLKEGDVLSEFELIKSESNLKKLGIFSTVNIKIIDDPSAPQMKIIKFSVRESERGLLLWGPGFRNDLGIRFFSQLSYSNLWGLDHTGLLNLSLNRRFSQYRFLEGKLQISYLWPWFGSSQQSFRPMVIVGRHQYINFAADTLTFSAFLDRHLLSEPHLTFSFGYSLERVHQFNALNVVNNDQLLIGQLSPRLVIDLRDHALMPTRGFWGSMSLEFASNYLGSYEDIGYYRLQIRSDYYIPLSSKIFGSLSWRTGYEKNIGPSNSFIPLIKQFTLGGIGSLRGYQEQELNYQNRVFDYLSYMNYRAQIDFPFMDSLKLGVFFDAANLMASRYTFGSLKYGAGFGLHYHTPLGPVNFDWGFKINPTPGKDVSMIHFSVGMI